MVHECTKPSPQQKLDINLSIDRNRAASAPNTRVFLTGFLVVL